MQKTVQVVDEFGSRYEATYPKRAIGLVKNGRARFIDDETICLVRPPNYTEDIKMTDIEKNEGKETVTERYTLAYAMEMIEKIAVNDQYLIETIHALGEVESKGPGDIVGAEKAKAASEIVRCRETTNQKLIEFYSKMVNDLRPRRESDDRAQFLDWVRSCTKDVKFDDPVRDLTEYGELYAQARRDTRNCRA